MLFSVKPRSTIAMLLAALTALLLSSIGCRSKSQPAVDFEPGLSGEPENYSATVVRAIDDGAEREVSASYVARLGELRREEWTEQAGVRALIWRPDQAKTFLLDLDKRIYVELPLSFGIEGGHQADSQNEAGKQADDKGILEPSDDAQRAIHPEAVERALDDAPSPVSVENRQLADQAIDDHVCKVFEQRATFSDGHAEITRTFRALALRGLAIRIEIMTEPQGESMQNDSTKLIISRRDIKTDVSPDEFVVPPGFRRVDKLPLR